MNATSTFCMANPNDPHLPIQGVNAVLIANTYHEFTDSAADSCSRVPVIGFRRTVGRRRSRTASRSEQGSEETAMEHHEVSSDQVESELRQAGFEIVSRQDRFIENDPFNENWWMITARKP